MTRFVESRLVAATPEATAAVVLDWTRDPAWRTAVASMVADPPEAAQSGQQLIERLRFAGLTFVTPTRVTARTETSAAFAGGSRLVRVWGNRRLEPTAEGTRVTISLEIEMTGLARPLMPMLAGAYRRRHRADLDRLVDLLDTAYVVATD